MNTLITVAPANICALPGCLQKFAGGTIMDKTGLKGLYDIPVSVPVSTQPDLLVKQLLDSVGLKLEPTKAPAEILKIKRISRPTEN